MENIAEDEEAGLIPSLFLFDKILIPYCVFFLNELK